ncbi:MAG: hypothetical protein F7B19_06460 [Desulfurococcales archaeon]|nr:hypothetical protein [Desulfurococcales archaeon]
MESNRRPTVFRWWGRRPTPLVRAFLSIAMGADPELALRVAEFDEHAVREVRLLGTGKKLIDPFSGSGVIPIEASKLGLEAVGQDVNPYAVALSRSASDLCTGACRVKEECLWRALNKTWQRIRGLWCNNDWCIVHVLLARCPPCTAPQWISSRRGKKGPKEILALDKDGRLKWIEPRDLEDRSSRIELPDGLPLEAEGYVAYALEVYNKNNGRRWISLLSQNSESLKWRRFLTETSRITQRINETVGGVTIPLMEETRRLYRHGRKRSDKLYTWRQNVSFLEFLRQASNCELEASLSVATASPSTSLLAIYYQPLAKVNPGMIVKSYWLPKNPVELNPFSHMNMPDDLQPGVRPIGRGTLLSVVNSYSEICGTSECIVPPSFIQGDSRVDIPGRDYDIIATDPPYPGLQTYKDLSLFYAHAVHLSGGKIDLGWDEIDTKNLREYEKGVIIALRRALSKSKDDAVVLLFISSPSSEGIAVVADVIASLERYGVGIEGVYPVIAEARGSLGRAVSKLVYVVLGKKGKQTRPEALLPLTWTSEIVEALDLSKQERDYSVKLSQVFYDMLKMKMKGA